MSNEEKNKIFTFKNKVFIDDELNVKKFNELDTKLQADIIREILSDIYSGKDIDIDNKYVLKCLKLTCDEYDNNVHLPLGLLVRKEGNIITFEFQKRVSIIFIILLIALLLLTMIGATYSAFRYIKLASLNKDLDGDGIADLNIDTNGDEKAEINIDTNGDDKPNYNIDYMGNRKAIFNVIVKTKNKDGETVENIVNKVNQVNEKGVCILNCDTNDDGWPDTNLDLDGDGKADINKDLDNDGKPDLNFDLDLNGECDLHCDTDDDDVCDKFCVDDLGSIKVTKNGSSAIIGSMITSSETAYLEVVYTDLTDVQTEGIVPDDQPSYTGEDSRKHTIIPAKEFTIENKSDIYVIYGLKFIVSGNTFETNNFKYKVECTESCEINNENALPDWTPVPHKDQVFAKDLYIAPGSKQKYKISFKLEGLGIPQNEDKGKIFTATVNVVFDY